jgi:hypothetical protein
MNLKRYYAVYVDKYADTHGPDEIKAYTAEGAQGIVDHTRETRFPDALHTELFASVQAAGRFIENVGQVKDSVALAKKFKMEPGDLERLIKLKTKRWETQHQREVVRAMQREAKHA